MALVGDWMFRTAWLTFLKRVIGRVGSLIQPSSSPRHVAVARSQHSTLPSKDKQHYIPRFLFKGFASKYISRKEVYVWYFERNGTEGREENTRDIGYEPDFYGALLDDLITKKENSYARVIDRVRSKRKIQGGDKEQVVEFVFSLALRTKHAREKLVSLIESSRDRIYPDLTDIHHWEGYLRTTVTSEYLREQFEKYIKSKFENIHPVAMDALWELSKKQLMSKFALEANSLAKEAVKKAEFFFSVIRWDKLAEDVGEKGHVSALTDFHQKTASQSYETLKLWRNFHWRVEEFPSNSLILGDEPVLQINKDSSVVSAFFGEGQRTTIVLPIRHDLLLIGSEDPYAKLPDLEVLNRSSEELSLSFFISSENRPTYEEVYHSLVGRMAPCRKTEPTAK